MDDINTKQIVDELIRIRKLLTILSQDKIQSFNESIEKKYLSTNQRRQMFEMFDGENSYKAIAEVVKLSSEAVRQFAVQLEQVGIVELVAVNGKSKNPKRIL